MRKLHSSLLISLALVFLFVVSTLFVLNDTVSEEGDDSEAVAVLDSEQDDRLPEEGQYTAADDLIEGRPEDPALEQDSYHNAFDNPNNPAVNDDAHQIASNTADRADINYPDNRNRMTAVNDQKDSLSGNAENPYSYEKESSIVDHSKKQPSDAHSSEDAYNGQSDMIQDNEAQHSSEQEIVGTVEPYMEAHTVIENEVDDLETADLIICDDEGQEEVNEAAVAVVTQPVYDYTEAEDVDFEDVDVMDTQTDDIDFDDTFIDDVDINDDQIDELVSSDETYYADLQSDESDTVIDDDDEEISEDTVEVEAEVDVGHDQLNGEQIMALLASSVISDSGTFASWFDKEDYEYRSIGSFGKQHTNCFSINTGASYNMWGCGTQFVTFNIEALNKFNFLQFTACGENGTSGEMDVSIYIDREMEGEPDYNYHFNSCTIPEKVQIQINGARFVSILVNNLSSHENRMVFYDLEAL